MFFCKRTPCNGGQSHGAPFSRRGPPEDVGAESPRIVSRIDGEQEERRIERCFGLALCLPPVWCAAGSLLIVIFLLRDILSLCHRTRELGVSLAALLHERGEGKAYWCSTNVHVLALCPVAVRASLASLPHILTPQI